MRFLLLLALLFGGCLPAFSGERYPFQNHTQAAEFDRLTHRFRCMVCQNEDLAASEATLATQLKDQLYQMVRSGQSSDTISQYMINRYGDFIMLKPPLVQRTYLLWGLPVLFLLIGMIVLYRLSRKSKGDGDA